MARQLDKPAGASSGSVGKTRAGKIRITQVRSGIGYAKKQKLVLAGLGLSRPGRSVVREDTPSIRGMCFKVRHLVEVEAIEDGGAEAR